jgi:hypothetical protein
MSGALLIAVLLLCGSVSCFVAYFRTKKWPWLLPSVLLLLAGISALIG